jgi:two-component sensor histidine kinase
LLLAPIALVLLAGSFLTARVIRRAQANSASLAAALDRNEQLFREIHHRVKNNLQSVTALLQVHAIPRDVRADLTQRLFAMSAVHEHIYRTGNFADVRIKDYLHTLIENVKAGADPRIVVIDDLADVTVDKDAAAPLGLILNEVLSNCFKHAFPDGKAGTVTVSLKRVSDDSVELSVEDDGVGYNDSIPAKGIGRKLVAGFAKQLGGDFTFSSHGGSKFVLTFPGR